MLLLLIARIGTGQRCANDHPRVTVPRMVREVARRTTLLGRRHGVPVPLSPSIRTRVLVMWRGRAVWVVPAAGLGRVVLWVMLLLGVRCVPRRRVRHGPMLEGVRVRHHVLGWGWATRRRRVRRSRRAPVAVALERFSARRPKHKRGPHRLRVVVGRGTVVQPSEMLSQNLLLRPPIMPCRERE